MKLSFEINRDDLRFFAFIISTNVITESIVSGHVDAFIPGQVDTLSQIAFCMVFYEIFLSEFVINTAATFKNSLET